MNSLGFNSIGPGGAKHIADLIATNHPSLKSLNMMGCDIGIEVGFSV